MAVKVIRRISNWILIVVVITSIVIFGLFYFGGDGETLVPNIWNPAYLDPLLYWIYIMFAICASGMILFGIIQFAGSFKANPKKSLMSLAALLCFALLFVVTYYLGSGTPIESLTSPETQQFNTESWLKLIDMQIFSIYALIGAAVLAIILGSLRMTLNK